MLVVFFWASPSALEDTVWEIRRQNLVSSTVNSQGGDWLISVQVVTRHWLLLSAYLWRSDDVIVTIHGYIWLFFPFRNHIKSTLKGDIVLCVPGKDLIRLQVNYSLFSHACNHLSLSVIVYVLIALDESGTCAIRGEECSRVKLCRIVADTPSSVHSFCDQKECYPHFTKEGIGPEGLNHFSQLVSSGVRIARVWIGTQVPVLFVGKETHKIRVSNQNFRVH